MARLTHLPSEAGADGRFCIHSGGPDRHDARLDPWGSVRVDTPVGAVWRIGGESGACFAQFAAPAHTVRAWYSGAREKSLPAWWSTS